MRPQSTPRRNSCVPRKSEARVSAKATQQVCAAAQSGAGSSAQPARPRRSAAQRVCRAGRTPARPRWRRCRSQPRACSRSRCAPPGAPGSGRRTPCRHAQTPASRHPAAAAVSVLEKRGASAHGTRLVLHVRRRGGQAEEEGPRHAGHLGGAVEASEHAVLVRHQQRNGRRSVCPEEEEEAKGNQRALKTVEGELNHAAARPGTRPGRARATGGTC